MNSFNQLQHEIFAILEEAGEEDMAALLNTVSKGHGSPDEIRALREALTALLGTGFIDFAKSLDESRRWIRQPKSESLALLGKLESFLDWSSPERLWKWNATLPRVEVLLTDAGAVAAREILLRDGWPEGLR